MGSISAYFGFLQTQIKAFFCAKNAKKTPKLLVNP